MGIDIDDLFGVAIGGILLADASPLSVGALQPQAAIAPKATHPLPELGILNTVAPVLRQGGGHLGRPRHRHELLAVLLLQPDDRPHQLPRRHVHYPVAVLGAYRGDLRRRHVPHPMMSSARTVGMSTLASAAPESIGPNISKILSQTSSSVVEGCNGAFSSSMALTVPEINEALGVCYEDLVECYDVLKEGQFYGYEVANQHNRNLLALLDEAKSLRRAVIALHGTPLRYPPQLGFLFESGVHRPKAPHMVISDSSVGLEIHGVGVDTFGSLEHDDRCG
ncbi:unnamed protein product [Miscanthus lutarioriparius]|uniref:Uncharacterized protein n=1 Tax=Miscanthus lutarioriparius TaxID=422564 RepID=A0A811MCF9_9POAL|nr:unnamed protein product [Miscanthus lutarioriparius]